MPAESKVVVLIPARWGSVRFPGKPLALIRSKPMIQWVVENSRKAERVDQVIVATDDSRISDAVMEFGGEVVMTGTEHVSGSDRIAEAACELDCDIVVNVQGDEPLISPDHIDAAVKALDYNPSTRVSSLMTRFKEGDDPQDPNGVKVVVDNQGSALYFSRACIPFEREVLGNETQLATYFRHLGLYAFRKQFLLEFTHLKPTYLEQTEKLEQLRILENGFGIQMVEVCSAAPGVDCEEDLKLIEHILDETETLSGSREDD